MNRKTVIAACVAILLMVAAIVAAVYALYSGTGPKKTVARKADSEFSQVLSAIPSDASAVLCFDGSRASERILADSTGFIKAVTDPDAGKNWTAFLYSLSRCKMAVSLHLSGTMVPLVVAQLPGRDSLETAKFINSAVNAGLKTRYLDEDRLLIGSRSETLVQSSVRYHNDGYSVVDSEGFEDALNLAGSCNMMLISHASAQKLYSYLVSSSRRGHAPEFRSAALWTALKIVDSGAGRIALEGPSSIGTGSFLETLKEQEGSKVMFPEVVPADARRVRALSVSDYDSFNGSVNHFRDVRGKQPVPLDKWIKGLGVDEIVCSELNDGSVLLVRSAQELSRGRDITPNPHPGAFASAFGPDFSIPGDSLVRSLGNHWSVVGSSPSLEEYEALSERKLKEALAQAGADVPSGPGYYAYSSMDETSVSDLFSRSLAQRAGALLKPGGYSPLLLKVRWNGGHPETSVEWLFKEGRARSKAAVMKDTMVVVPKGPFKVKNSSTGKINTFYQNNYLSLCLNDENGKGVWGIPFKEPICGFVKEIDYYNNGRLQYLFAAGGKLYLIDRLGRFVNGFPVNLGKDVLLGPEVYDFTGAKGYRVMILHKDNTLQMYDLHAVRPEKWKGIAPEATIKRLPDLIEAGGTKYWLVTTASGEELYPFYGGEKIPAREQAKIMKSTKTK